MIAPDATMADLAQIISTRTQQIDAFLTKEKLPQPSSLAEGEVTSDFLPKDDLEIQKAREELRDATKQVHCLTAGTDQLLVDISEYSQHDANALRVAYIFAIPKHVPLGRSISYSTLAEKCGLHESRLIRVVRYLLTTFIFTETPTGEVANSAVSKVLATNPLAWAWSGPAMDIIFPCMAQSTQALQKSQGSDAPNHAAFNLAYDTELGAFAYFGGMPERVARTSGSSAPPWEVSGPAAISYDFSLTSPPNSPLTFVGELAFQSIQLYPGSTYQLSSDINGNDAGEVLVCAAGQSFSSASYCAQVPSDYNCYLSFELTIPPVPSGSSGTTTPNPSCNDVEYDPSGTFAYTGLQLSWTGPQTSFPTFDATFLDSISCVPV